MIILGLLLEVMDLSAADLDKCARTTLMLIVMAVEIGTSELQALLAV